MSDFFRALGVEGWLTLLLLPVVLVVGIVLDPVIMRWKEDGSVDICDNEVVVESECGPEIAVVKMNVNGPIMRVGGVFMDPLNSPGSCPPSVIIGY